jgi:hypothetical protein
VPLLPSLHKGPEICRNSVSRCSALPPWPPDKFAAGRSPLFCVLSSSRRPSCSAAYADDAELHFGLRSLPAILLTNFQHNFAEVGRLFS